MRVGPNVYLRSDGRWEARYQKTTDQNGRAVYGCTYGKTKEEAALKRVEKLSALDGAADYNSILASRNPGVTTLPLCLETGGRDRLRREKFKPPFEREAGKKIQKVLLETDESGSTAFLLSLLLGLSVRELAALQYGDICFASHTANIMRTTMVENRRLVPVQMEGRIIPLTNQALWLLTSRGIQEKDPTHYVLTDMAESVDNTRRIECCFRKLIQPVVDARGLTSESLRSTFIQRCLEVDLNIETVSALTGADRESLYRYFGKYIQAHPMDIKRLDHRSEDSESVRHLNLLILGAGSHGRGVKEIAKMSGVFGKISFLDDRVEGPDVVGKCAEYLNYQRVYPAALPAFSDNELRALWTERLRAAGFLLPRLIHPSAIVSDNVEIGEGSVVMAQATVNAGTQVGESCIIAPNSTIGFGSKVGSYSHLDSGCIISKDTVMPEKTVVESGEVYKSTR